MIGSATKSFAALAVLQLVNAGRVDLDAPVRGYVLAGLVAERASGQTYSDYLQREMFGPLGMTRSSASTDPAGSDALAGGHRFWFGVTIATEPTRLTWTPCTPGSSTASLPARGVRRHGDDGAHPV